MPKVSVDTRDLDKIIERVKEVKDILPGGRKGLSKPFKDALDLVGKKIMGFVLEETPVGDDTDPGYHATSTFHKDKTHLRDSWKWRVKVKGTLVEGYAYVAHDRLNDLIDLLEAGSPRHTIQPKPGSVLRFYTKEGGSWNLVYTRRVEHPGFRPNKFTDRAQNKADDVVRELIPIVQDEINRVILGQ